HRLDRGRPASPGNLRAAPAALHQDDGPEQALRHGAVKLHELVTTSRQVAATGGRRAKIDLLAALLKRTAADEIETAIAALSGSLRQDASAWGTPRSGRRGPSGRRTVPPS